METDAITWVICPVTVFKFGRVAQLVEQVTFNHWVTGSNPVALTITLYQQTVNKSPPAMKMTGGYLCPNAQGRKS